VAGTNTVTIPAAAGTVMVSGNMPAFSVYQTTSQTLSTGVLTKIQFQTKNFDTNNCFDATTNYRFTPTVAGYYQFSASCYITSVSAAEVSYVFYKNGSQYQWVFDGIMTSPYIINGSCLIYLNGTTDYVEFYGVQATGTSKTTSNNSLYTWFSGSMVRGA